MSGKYEDRINEKADCQYGKRSGKVLIAFGILIFFYPLLAALTDYWTDRIPYGCFSDVALDVNAEKQEDIYSVGELTDGSVLTQSFIIDTKKPVSGIRVHGATYMRKNQGRLQIRLLDIENQKLVKTWIKDISKMSDNSYFILSLGEKGQNLSGKMCMIEIRAQGGWPGNAVTFYANRKDVYEDGFLQLNGIRQHGDLCFQILEISKWISFWNTKMWLRIYVTVLLEIFIYLLYGKINHSRRKM